MASAVRSRPQVDERPRAYDGFMGLDTSRDITAMESGEQQHLSRIENATCDWRGQIEVDAGGTYRHGLLPVRHARHLSRDIIAYAQVSEAGLTLTSDRNHDADLILPKAAEITSAVFNRRALFFAAGQPCFVYDGAIWRQNPSNLLAATPASFGVAVSRRLCVSGFVPDDTKVSISRVDREDVFTADEASNEISVLRAGDINIANILNTGDYITGLAAFEQDRLAIFTQDRVLVYAISPDVTTWTIDSRINIQVGCISHNTICQAGESILFCSRSGVHAFRRSSSNGITVATSLLSDKVAILYRELVRTVASQTLISATFDRDEGNYHIFFPQPDGLTCIRLVCAMPMGDDMPARWSSATFLNAQCACFLAGSFVLGTPAGLYDMKRREELTATTYPTAIFETPILWHGQLDETKETRALIVQASGAAFLTIEAFDDKGRKFHHDEFEIQPEADDALFSGVPLIRQYERRFEHRYRGMRLRFTVTGRGQVRITGFAVTIKK